MAICMTTVISESRETRHGLRVISCFHSRRGQMCTHWALALNKEVSSASHAGVFSTEMLQAVNSSTTRMKHREQHANLGKFACFTSGRKISMKQVRSGQSFDFSLTPVFSLRILPGMFPGKHYPWSFRWSGGPSTRLQISKNTVGPKVFNQSLLVYWGLL